MTLRVYRYGCLPPIEGVDVVRAQLRAAHDYRNDLVAIERGRRAIPLPGAAAPPALAPVITDETPVREELSWPAATRG